MKKVTLIISVFFSCIFPGYSQTDTIPAVAGDTVVIRQDPVITDQHVKQKKRPLIKGEQVYKLKPAVDLPVVAVGTAWSLYAFTKIYNKPDPTLAELSALKKSDINSFDRWGQHKYDKNLDVNSYYPFYGAIPVPILLFLTGNNMRNDFWKLSFLYWETMSMTGLFGTSGTYWVDRWRPYSYSPETPLDDKLKHNPKNSFYAGHVELVATCTFFAAKVYSDYYPDSKVKWLFYGVAGAWTGSVAYMRLAGGMHFPSDILLGLTMGSLTGILVPQFHKVEHSASLGVLPFRSGDANGLTFVYRFKDKK